jgi:hypothetical protein
MTWLLAHPLPRLRQQVVSLSQSSCVSPVELTGGRGGGGERGVGDVRRAKSYDREKALPSIIIHLPYSSLRFSMVHPIQVLNGLNQRK